MENTNVGYCLRCKQRREISNPEEIVMKNGRAAIKGICSVCGTGMFRILGMKKEEAPATENEGDSLNEI